METFLIKAAQLILALALLVTVHEFGHYIFARIFGMRVDRFYLFFNPWFSLLKYFPDKGRVELIAWTTPVKDSAGNIVDEERHSLLSFRTRAHDAEKKGRPTWAATLYGIGWLPLGGYCSIAGMIDETTDSDKLAAEPEPWEFRAKKPWPRLMVMAAGVLMNFITAIVIYIGIAAYWGERVIPFDQAAEGMNYIEQLHGIGLRDGDILLKVNGRKADATDASIQWDMVQDGATITVKRQADTLTVTVPDGFTQALIGDDSKKGVIEYRVPAKVLKSMPGEKADEAGILAGDRIVRVANDTTPSLTEFYAALNAHKGKEVPMLVLRDGKTVSLTCAISDNGKIGIQLTPITDIYPVAEIDYNIFEAVPKGIDDGVDRLSAYVSSLKMLFTPEGAQSVGGFGAIGDMFPGQWNWYAFWNICAFLSVILAFMNILPIPALDGGHIMFVLWEIVTGRKASTRVLEVAQYIGMAFLFLLLVYANANDIYRFFIK